MTIIFICITCSSSRKNSLLNRMRSPERPSTERSPTPERSTPIAEIYVDEQVFIKRLGNKLKDLLEYAEVRLYYRSDAKTCVQAMINNTNEYTEEEIRQEALEIIWRLLAESYEPNYDEMESLDEWPSEDEIRQQIEGILRLRGFDA